MTLHRVGVVPAWLGRLELLYHLDLSENRLTGSSSAVHNVSITITLWFILFALCQIDVEPGALGGPLISEINLARNKLTGKWMHFCKSC